jgi:prepilin signal peptidase PulO-like enzyme (type II secretory pathway)
MAILLILTAVLGVGVGWALTVPVHRYKEFRPMTPRDVGAEVGTADTPPLDIRAEYREARCPHCHHVYSSGDVVPVLSWFRGCPGCGTRLPATVPLIQLGVPVAMVLTVALLNGSWVALPYLWLVVVVAAVSIIDLRIWLIPYWMPWLGAAVGLVLIAAVSIGIGAPEAIVWAVVGAIGSFVLFFVLFLLAPGKLGFGDVRLVLLLGLFLGWIHPLFPIYGLLFGSLIGLAMGLGALATNRGSRFPFGPALALGALLAVWLHGPLLDGLGVT